MIDLKKNFNTNSVADSGNSLVSRYFGSLVRLPDVSSVVPSSNLASSKAHTNSVNGQN
jgi:hypothetical protein